MNLQHTQTYGKLVTVIKGNFIAPSAHPITNKQKLEISPPRNLMRELKVLEQKKQVTQEYWSKNNQAECGD